MSEISACASAATIGVVANAAAANNPAAGPSQRRTTPNRTRTATTVSITCGSRIDHVEKPKTRADNASTMKAPGSLSSVIDAAGSYPA